jgi:hypothetical protein
MIKDIVEKAGLKFTDPRINHVIDLGYENNWCFNETICNAVKELEQYAIGKHTRIIRNCVTQYETVLDDGQCTVTLIYRVDSGD